MGASVIVPGVLGALGLMQSGRQATDQNRATNRALSTAEGDSARKGEMYDILKKLADEYDPKKQTETSVNYASDVAGQTLEKALRGISTNYSGANPGGDTAFHISGQRAANDALDPLKAFAANESAMEPMRKAEMYQRATNAPTGNLSDSYFRAASMMPRSNPAGSLNLLSQALQGWLSPQGGAGGTGDQAGSNASGGTEPGQVTNNWDWLTGGGFGGGWGL